MWEFVKEGLLFDIIYKKIIINLVNVGVRKGRIIMFMESVNYSGADLSYNKESDSYKNN
jgi:hypothetical protein